MGAEARDPVADFLLDFAETTWRGWETGVGSGRRFGGIDDFERGGEFGPGRRLRPAAGPASDPAAIPRARPVTDCTNAIVCAISSIAIIFPTHAHTSTCQQARGRSRAKSRAASSASGDKRQFWLSRDITVTFAPCIAGRAPVAPYGARPLRDAASGLMLAGIGRHRRAARMASELEQDLLCCLSSGEAACWAEPCGDWHCSHRDACCTTTSKQRTSEQRNGVVTSLSRRQLPMFIRTRAGASCGGDVLRTCGRSERRQARHFLVRHWRTRKS